MYTDEEMLAIVKRVRDGMAIDFGLDPVLADISLRATLQDFEQDLIDKARIAKDGKLRLIQGGQNGSYQDGVRET